MQNRHHMVTGNLIIVTVIKFHYSLDSSSKSTAFFAIPLI
jgi:hypothetical protein